MPSVYDKLNVAGDKLTDAVERVDDMSCVDGEISRDDFKQLYSVLDDLGAAIEEAKKLLY